MAFRRNKGLKYFPLVTDFFQDRDIRRLMLNFGQRGTLLYIYLLCCLYGRGYVLRWDEDLMQDAAIDLRCEPEELQRSVDYMLEKGLFDRELFLRRGLLSSEAIQRQFQDCARVMRKKCLVDEELWLLGEEDTNTFISFSDAHDEQACAKEGAFCAKTDADCAKEGSNCAISTQRKGKENKKKLKEMEMEAATAAEENDEAGEEIKPPSEEGGGLSEAKDGGRDEATPQSRQNKAIRSCAAAGGGTSTDDLILPLPIEGRAFNGGPDSPAPLTRGAKTIPQSAAPTAPFAQGGLEATGEAIPHRPAGGAPFTQGGLGAAGEAPPLHTSAVVQSGFAAAQTAGASRRPTDSKGALEEILGEFEGFMSMSDFAQKTSYKKSIGKR